MRVPDLVHFVHALNDRTIAAVARCLTEQMLRMGHETVVVASSVDGDEPLPAGVKAVDLGGSGRRTIPTIGALAKVLKEIRPATVFAHAEGPARAAVLASMGMRRRPQVIGVIHNHYSTYPWSAPRTRRRIDALMLRRLDAVVGVSPGVAQDLRETFPAAAAQVRTIPSPLTRWESLEQLAAEPIDHPWFADDRPVVVSVGHVHPRKDHATLVRAIASLRESGGAFPRLAIIGADRGVHAAHIRELIAGMHLDDAVTLMGPKRNPFPYVAAADAFVLSSRNEGLGLVLLEAMAVGTPVISTDAPSGPRWLLEDGRAGLLTPVADAPALAEAIRRLLGDDGLRARLAAAGRARLDEFTPKRVAQRYLELAESLR